MANPADRLRQFIPAASPLGRAGGADLLLRVTGGNYAGAATLAAIARKESSFGQQAFAPNNYWGYGVHAGPSINTAPSVEAMASRVWKALNGGLYRGAGLTTLPSILSRYAPPSENNTSLYRQQTSDWLRQLGVDPGSNIFQPGGRVLPTTAPSARGAQTAGGPLPPSGLPAVNSLSPQALRALTGYLNKSEQDVYAGRVTNSAPVFAVLGSSSGGGTLPALPPGSRPGPSARPTPSAHGGGGGRYGTPFGTTFTLPALPGAVAAVPSTGSIKNPKGQTVATTTFDGKPVSEWWASMLRFARAHGWKGTVNSGYRSIAEQQQIWNRHPDPTWVARPGSSPHQYAMAVDISDGPGLERVIRQYRLPIARYSPEGWHFEPLGFRTNGTQTTFW